MWRRHAATWYGLRCGGVPRTGVVRLLRTRWGSLAPPAAPLSAAWVATEHSRMSLAVCVSTRRRTYDRHRAESQMNRVDHAAALEDGKVIPPSPPLHLPLAPLWRGDTTLPTTGHDRPTVDTFVACRASAACGVSMRPCVLLRQLRGPSSFCCAVVAR